MKIPWIDRPLFFSEARRTLFGGRLKKGQVEGLSAILDAWQARVGEGELPQLAYVLATAFHETAATMQPVRETLARTDEAAIARLEKAYGSGRLRTVKTPYWRPDADGRSWLGRGLVQLTHKRNYARMCTVTGCNLLADPSLAMRMDVAVAILIEGMRQGSFTGHKLEDFLCGDREDWMGARRIINGTDRAALVADYGRRFAAAVGTERNAF